MKSAVRVFVSFALIAFLGTSSIKAEKPRIVAHRGLLRHAPENTLSNFRACLALRLGFEFDVQRTRDGRLVCIHDDTVDRTTDGSGKVADMTLAEIQKLDAGSWFSNRFANERPPSVREVLDLVSRYRDANIVIAVDLKTGDAGREVAALAAERNVLPRLLFIGRTIVDPDLRAMLRKTAPQANIATVANNTSEFQRALNDKSADWVYFRYVPTREEMRAVRAAKKRSFIAGATVAGAQPDNWRAAAEAGLHAILTDYPLELRRVLQEDDASQSR